MAALTADTVAPDFSLPDLKGDAFSLQSALKTGPVLIAFFKVSCPTCQYTFPFLERLHQAHDYRKITMVGISQNNQSDTAAFLTEFGITFPTLLDDPNQYAVSNAYGLTNVPTLFLISQNRRIELSTVGWVKKDVEELNRNLAAAQQVSLPVIFKPGEEIRDFRAG